MHTGETSTDTAAKVDRFRVRVRRGKLEKTINQMEE